MLNKAIRLIILCILVGAAICAMFFVMRLLFRLLIIGAVVLAVFALIRAWSRGSGEKLVYKKLIWFCF